MNKFKDSYQKHKDWYLFAVFCAFLVLIILNRINIHHGVNALISALSPLIFGIIFSFILNIPMSQIEKFIKSKSKNKEKGKRGISILLTYILVAFIVTILLIVIIPQLISTISTLARNAEDLITNLYANIDSIGDFLLNNFNIDISTDTSFENLLAQLGISIEAISQGIQDILNSIGGGMISSLQSFGNGVYNIFMGLIIAVYLLAKKENFTIQLKKIIISIFSMNTANRIVINGRIVIDIFRNFISGQLLEAVIIGVMIFIIMTILNLPFALMISCVVAVLAIIPIFGNIIAMVIGAILILAVNPLQSLYFIIAYQVVQQLENNLIYPRVVGSSVGLPPLWTLLAVSIFGSIAGLGGMLIGVPTTASVYTLGGKFVKYIMNKKRVTISEDGYYIPIIEKTDENNEIKPEE